MEIHNISSYNVTVSNGLWLFYSSPHFQGETVVSEFDIPASTNDFRSLRGFCIGSSLLAIFSHRNFTGNMTVLSTTANKLLLKAKSAVAISNSWAISWLGFRSPRLLECSKDSYAIFRSLPKESSVPQVRAVKKLTEDGVAKFKAVYG